MCSFSPLHISSKQCMALIHRILLNISPITAYLSQLEMFCTKYWTNEENFLNFTKTELPALFNLTFIELHSADFADFLNNVFFEMIPTTEYSITNYQSIFSTFSEAVHSNKIHSDVYFEASLFISHIFCCVSYYVRNLTSFFINENLYEAFDSLTSKLSPQQKVLAYAPFFFSKNDDLSPPPNYHHTQHLYELFRSDQSLHSLIFHMISTQIECDPKIAAKINSAVPLLGWFVEGIPLQELSHFLTIISISSPDLVSQCFPILFRIIASLASQLTSTRDVLTEIFQSEISEFSEYFPQSPSKYETIEISHSPLASAEGIVDIIGKQLELKYITYSYLHDVGFYQAFVENFPRSLFAEMIAKNSLFNSIVAGIYILPNASSHQYYIFERILNSFAYFDANKQSNYCEIVKQYLTKAPTAKNFELLLYHIDRFRKYGLSLTLMLKDVFIKNSQSAENFIKVKGIDWLFFCFDQQVFPFSIEDLADILASLVLFRSFDELDIFIEELPENHALFSLSTEKIENLVYGTNQSPLRPIRVSSLMYLLKPYQDDQLDPYNAYILGSHYVTQMIRKGYKIFEIPMITEIANRHLTSHNVTYLLKGFDISNKGSGIVNKANFEKIQKFADLSKDHFPLFEFYPENNSKLIINKNYALITFWFKFLKNSDNILSSPSFFINDHISLSIENNSLIVNDHPELPIFEINSYQWNFISIKFQRTLFSSHLVLTLNNYELLVPLKHQNLASSSEFSIVAFSFTGNSICLLGPIIRLFSSFDKHSNEDSSMSNDQNASESLSKEIRETKDPLIHEIFETGPSDGHTLKYPHEISSFTPFNVKDNFYPVSYLGFPYHFYSKDLFKKLFYFLPQSTTFEEFSAVLNTILQINSILKSVSSRFWITFFDEIRKANDEFLNVSVWTSIMQMYRKQRGEKEVLETLTNDISFWKKSSSINLMNTIFNLEMNIHLLPTFELFLVKLVQLQPNQKLIELIMKHHEITPKFFKLLVSIFPLIQNTILSMLNKENSQLFIICFPFKDFILQLSKNGYPILIKLSKFIDLNKYIIISWPVLWRISEFYDIPEAWDLIHSLNYSQPFSLAMIFGYIIFSKGMSNKKDVQKRFMKALKVKYNFEDQWNSLILSYWFPMIWWPKAFGNFFNTTHSSFDINDYSEVVKNSITLDQKLLKQPYSLFLSSLQIDHQIPEFLEMFSSVLLCDNIFNIFIKFFNTYGKPSNDLSSLINFCEKKKGFPKEKIDQIKILNESSKCEPQKEQQIDSQNDSESQSHQNISIYLDELQKENYQTITTEISNFNENVFLTDIYIHTSLNFADAYFSISTINASWHHYIRSLTQPDISKSQFILAPFCMPFSPPRLLTPVPNIDFDFNLCNKLFLNSKEFFNLFSSKYGTPTSTFQCELLRYVNPIPSILFCYSDNLLILAFSQFDNQDPKSINFTTPNPTIKDRFMECVAVGHWGAATLFGSGVLIHVPYNSIIMSQKLNENDYCFWTFRCGAFILKFSPQEVGKLHLRFTKINSIAQSSFPKYDFLFFSRNESHRISAVGALLIGNAYANRSFFDVERFPAFPYLPRDFSSEPFLGFPPTQEVVPSLSSLLPFSLLTEKPSPLNSSEPYYVEDVPPLNQEKEQTFAEITKNILNKISEKEKSKETTYLSKATEVPALSYLIHEISSFRSFPSDISTSDPVFVQWLVKSFHINPSLIPINSLAKTIKSPAPFCLGDIDLYHVNQMLTIELKRDETVRFDGSDIIPYPAKQIHINGRYYAVLKKELMAIWITTEDGTNILSKTSLKLGYATGITASSNGLYLSADFEFGLTKVYGITYRNGVPSSLQTISTHSWPHPVSTVFLSFDWLCASYFGHSLTLWNFSTHSIHRVIDLKSKSQFPDSGANQFRYSYTYSSTLPQADLATLAKKAKLLVKNVQNTSNSPLNSSYGVSNLAHLAKAIQNGPLGTKRSNWGSRDFEFPILKQAKTRIEMIISDEEEAGFWLITATKVFYLRANGTIVCQFIPDGIITAACIIPTSSLKRYLIYGNKRGKVFLVMADLKVEVRELPSLHQAQITRIILHDSRSCFVTVDGFGKVFLWSTIGLNSPEFKLKLYKACMTCGGKATEFCQKCGRAICKKCYHAHEEKICPFCCSVCAYL